MTARPMSHRPLPVAAALLGAAWLALAALPTPGHAHQAIDHKADAASAPGAAAETVQVQGRVGEITVSNKLTGTTQRVRVLIGADGDRFLLKDAGKLSLGATVEVTARAEGRTLFAQGTRQLAAAPTAQALRNAAPAWGERTGTLRMLHMDFPDGTAEFRFVLIGDNGGRSNVIDMGTLLPQLENGMRARIAGPVDANGYISVDEIDILAPPVKKDPPLAASGSGDLPLALTTGYTVIPLKYPNNTAAPYTYNSDLPSWPISAIDTSVFGVSPAQSVAEYYKEVSFGAQLVNGVVAHNSSTWLKANEARPTTCSSSAQLDAVLYSIETQGNAAAAAAGFSVSVSSTTGAFYIIDSLPCGWLGLGYIGWNKGYAKGTAALGVVGHEVGHNFGLYHAGRLACGASAIATSGCSVTEYGDPFVIMGNISSMHLDAYQKNLLGYIAPGTVSNHASGSVQYTLGPIELASQSKYAVKIPTGNANRTYWVEFRRPIGFDSALPAGAIGAQVRLARPFEWNNCGGCSGLYDDTQLLDMTPGDSNFNNAALPVGNSFVDSLQGITIQVVSASTTDLVVAVTKSGSLTPTTTTLVSSVNPSTVGQSVTFTASVAGTTPTGTVAFTDGGVGIAGCSSVALTGAGNTRTAACTTSALAAGAHGIVASYSGDGTNAPSSNVSLSQVVNAVVTTSTTGLASSVNPAIAGNSVVLTATVNGNSPTGTVAFKDGGVNIGGCATVSLSGAGNTRTAACTTSALSVSVHSIVASYSGDASNTASNSQTLLQTIKAASSTVLASSLNPSTAGASVTFTATVNGNAPTGTVAFTADGAGIGACSAIALTGAGNSRTAACTTSALATGTRSIVASYSGDVSNTAANSQTLLQTIKAASSTALASSLNPSTAGASVTFTATVNGSAPTGSVAFAADGAAIAACSAVAVTGSGDSRTAACTTSALATGTRSIVASYGGDGGNVASVSSALSQVVNVAPPVATTMTLDSNLNPALVGNLVTLTATVNGNNPTGTIAFRESGASVGGCAAVAVTGAGNSRTAVCATSSLTQGTHSLTAHYAGDGANLASTSGMLSQVINPVSTSPSTTTMSSTPNPADVGVAVSITATVTGVAPTGTVAFSIVGVPIAGCTSVALVGGGNTRTATCTTSSLPTGSHPIKGFYSGDGANAPSVGLAVTQTIGLPGKAAVPLYRFNTGSYHFYTISETEKNYIQATFPTWVLEGIVYYVFDSPVVNTTAVYRFNTGSYHFFTISAAERDYVLATFPQWAYEGVAFYTYPGVTAGSSPVYRFNTGALHFYTISATERDYVLANFPTWSLEGVGYYARLTP